MSGYFATPAEREAYIDGLLALAAYLTEHPDVPTPRYEELQLSTFGDTMADRMATVDEFAALVGAQPQWWGGGQTHYKAEVKFGPVALFCVAILKDDEPVEAVPDPDLAAADAAWHREHPGETCPNGAWCPRCGPALVNGDQFEIDTDAQAEADVADAVNLVPTDYDPRVLDDIESLGADPEAVA
jgi:hypothetical protein